MRCKLWVLMVGFVITLGMTLVAQADPIRGRNTLKFSQLPMVNTPLPNPQMPGGVEFFHGHDELSTAWGVAPAAGGVPQFFEGRFMADDFADRFSSPVVHVRWWGSYLNRPTSLPPEDAFVRRFLISFEKDVPGPIPPTPDGFSHPGEPILNQIVTHVPYGPPLAPASGTFTEHEIYPVSKDGPIYEYNAELNLGKEFFQEPDTVYWLKIVALDVIPSPNIPMDQRLQWGWHNRDYTIHDPFASVPPAVAPGEFIDGFLPGLGGVAIPIYHFQDDAVTGGVNIIMDPNMPRMPQLVEQFDMSPTRYEAPWDGPTLIATHSKDLAFQLFTVPEPAGCALMALAIVSYLLIDRSRG